MSSDIITHQVSRMGSCYAATRTGYFFIHYIPSDFALKHGIKERSRTCITERYARDLVTQILNEVAEELTLERFL